jgi:hypothetical protein
VGWPIQQAALLLAGHAGRMNGRLLAGPVTGVVARHAQQVDCWCPLEVGIFENQRTEPNSNFNIFEPNRTRTVREEVREEFGKKFVLKFVYLA